MVDVFTVDNLQEKQTGCIVEVRSVAADDPYAKMAKSMGLEPGLRLTRTGYDEAQEVYIFSSPEAEFGLPIEVCQRVYVRQCD